MSRYCHDCAESDVKLFSLAPFYPSPDKVGTGGYGVASGVCPHFVFGADLRKRWGDLFCYAHPYPFGGVCAFLGVYSLPNGQPSAIIHYNMPDSWQTVPDS